jgi:hypothetical protein
LVCFRLVSTKDISWAWVHVLLSDIDGGPFQDAQERLLNTLSGDVSSLPTAITFAGDFIYFVDENDA